MRIYYPKGVTPKCFDRGTEVGHDVYVSARVFAYLIGLKEPRFELETFATSDRERRLVTMYRTFRLAGTPYI